MKSKGPNQIQIWLCVADLCHLVDGGGGSRMSEAGESTSSLPEDGWEGSDESDSGGYQVDWLLFHRTLWIPDFHLYCPLG